MTRTLSCGELKDTKFVKGEDGILTKVKGKPGDNINDSDIVKLPGGSRILKVENKEQLDEYLKENHIDPKDPEGSLKKFLLSREFDGISIDKKTLEKLDNNIAKSFFNDKYGVRVVNEDIFKEEYKNKSYRNGFKADATELTKESKEVFSSVYHEINQNKSFNAIFRRHNIDDYHIKNEGGVYTFKGEDVSEDIKDLRDAIKKRANQENKPNINLVGGRGSVRVLKDGSIEMSTGDALRIQNIYTSIYRKDISKEDLVDCLSLYAQGLEKSNFTSYKNVSKKLDNLTKELKTSLEYNEEGKRVKTCYLQNHKAIFDLSKETLHKEKVAWNHVLSNATPEQKEVFEAIAKIKFRTDTENHLKTINSREGNYTFGDLNITYDNPDASKDSKLKDFTRKNISEVAYHSNNVKQTSKDTVSNVLKFGSKVKTNIFEAGSSVKRTVYTKINNALLKVAAKFEQPEVKTETKPE